MYVNPQIKDTERVFPEQERAGYLRLDMNENPAGLPKEFVDEVLAEITPEFLAAYPESERFRKSYAEYIGTSSDYVMATNGTDMAIRYILETFGESGKDVVTVSPTFEMYRINCSILGLCHVPVTYEDDLTISGEKIIRAITEDTRIVVLLNPNNPMGNVYSVEEFERIWKKASSVGAVVLVDEAYHYFYPDTFLDYALQKENVLVTRTFSKLFSIPALRLGVVVGDPQLIHYLRNGQLSFDVNAVALLFGERLLQRPDLMDGLIQAEREGRDWLCERLEETGYEYIRGEGNYVLIRTRLDAHEVERRLREEHRVLIHAYGEGMLRKFIRVSTGDVSVMERFWEVFHNVDAKSDI